MVDIALRCPAGHDGRVILVTQQNFTSWSVGLSMATNTSGYNTSNLFISCAPGLSSDTSSTFACSRALTSIFGAVSKTRKTCFTDWVHTRVCRGGANTTMVRHNFSTLRRQDFCCKVYGLSQIGKDVTYHEISISYMVNKSPDRWEGQTEVQAKVTSEYPFLSLGARWEP
jgi:hypothetical protein